jgi:hypothetical protein
MNELPVNTKTELLASIESSWSALNVALERLTEDQKTSLADPQGWTVKDHLIHLSAWERSVSFFLQGQPRHAGLGVNEAVYENGSVDQVNQAIFQQRKEMPLSEALLQFKEVHQQLMKLIEPLTDTDLHKPYRAYLPDKLDDERRAMEVIYDNTTGHYREHQGWIESLVGNDS